MLFQLVQTKFFKSELFSCLLKDDHVITRSNGKGLFLGPRTVRNCVKVGSSSLLAELYFWHAFYLVRVFRVANTHVVCYTAVFSVVTQCSFPRCVTTLKTAV